MLDIQLHLPWIGVTRACAVIPNHEAGRAITFAFRRSKGYFYHDYRARRHVFHQEGATEVRTDRDMCASIDPERRARSRNQEQKPDAGITHDVTERVSPGVLTVQFFLSFNPGSTTAHSIRCEKLT